MLQEYLSNTPLVIWPLVALALFFVTFVIVLISTFVGFLRKQNFDRIANLPLEEDVTGLGESS